MIDISLIVPSYNGAPWIEHALQSVVEQTIGRDRFEVLVVVNGKDDGASSIAESFLSKYKGFQYTVIMEERASLANARNIGITAARGRCVTWLDVDDWISPSYLELLADSFEDGVMPLAGIVDVNEETGEEVDSPHTRALEKGEPGPVHPRTFWTNLGVAAAKVLSVSQARSYLFDTTLRNGEDVAFFAPYVSKFGLKVDPTPALRGAKYYRLVREGSLGRQKVSWEFSVLERIEVMRRLDAAIASADQDMAAVLRSLMNSQAIFMRQYLEEYPEEYSRVTAALMRADISHLPVKSIRPNTNRLLISYNFAPWNDASGTVAAKRAIESGFPWNVVSKNMSMVRKRDHGTELLGDIASSQHVQIPGNPAFGAWSEVSNFCREGLAAIEELERAQGSQNIVYSRSMWPASHFLGALQKLRDVDRVHWTAEFSDPLRRDVQGGQRKGAVGEDWLSAQLIEAAVAEGFWLPRDESLFVWAELVPYIFADELLFTNSNQLAYMLSYLDDGRLRDRVKRHATIRPHPTLPRDYYSLRRAPVVTSPQRLTIGYFGSFYPNRSLNDLLTAIDTNSTEFRGKVELHIFSGNGQDIENKSGADIIRVHQSIGYLEALAEMDTMDVLVVEDASTRLNPAGLNPYLPSKVSDYLGSSAATWAIAEPGSPLSRSGAEFISRLGDAESALGVLRRLVEGAKQ